MPNLLSRPPSVCVRSSMKVRLRHVLIVVIIALILLAITVVAAHSGM